MKKNIAIIAGGNSSEYVVSVRSAAQIYDLIDKSRYEVMMITVKDELWIAHLGDKTQLPVDLNDFSVVNDGEKILFDYAFIIIHGTPGEDGKIQAYLDMKNVPYNTGGVLCNALTFNKDYCKHYLKSFDILSADSLVVRKNNLPAEEEIIGKVGLPCFVKPNEGGSSFGISRVNKQDELTTALEKGFREDDELIIESFIEGTELSCGLLKTSREELVFPVTEIVSHNEFFDYEAKYTVGKADEITPARVTDELQKRVQKLSSFIYDLLECRGIVRIDFIVKNNSIYFLELNTIPGMSKESIVPKQIRAAGFREEEIIEKIIREGLGEN